MAGPGGMKRITATVVFFLGLGVLPLHSQTFLVLPFRDKSDFAAEHWNIEQSLPRVLSDTLAAVPGYTVVPFEQVVERFPRRWRPGSLPAEVQALARRHGARYAVLGTIQEFSISRFNVGSPMLGGYGAYRVKIQVHYTLVDVETRDAVAARTAVADVKNRKLGLTLLGKPAAGEVDYAALDSIEFASQEFRQTLVGRAVHLLKADFVGQVRTVVPTAADRHLPAGSFQEASVLLVREAELYLAAGSADGVQPGDEFDVYTDGEELRDPATQKLLGYADRKVGRIRVEVVRDQHLSLARILAGAGDIRAKDRVRITARSAPP